MEAVWILLALVVVMVDGIMWLSGRGASPLITLQHQRAISGGGGGWKVFSVPVSLHQHQRKISLPGLSVWECKWVCLPLLLLLSSPPPSLCSGAGVAEERKRWDVVIVTVSRYSGGEWPSGEMWCGKREWASQTWTVCVCVWWGLKLGPGLVDDWGFSGPLQGHWRRQTGLGPVLCHPGPGSQPDRCLFMMSLRALLLIVSWVGWPLWCFKRLRKGEISTDRTWPGLTSPSEYWGYTGSIPTVIEIY